MTLFLRVLEAADKATALKDSISTGASTYEVDPSSFAQVPGSPFAYWVSDRIRRLFKELPPFEGEGRTVRQGLATADDFRFVRAWWEPPESKFSTKWFPFAKGGAYSPYYADIHLVVNWEDSGKEMEAFPGSVIRNPSFYFRPGLTWPIKNRNSLKPWLLSRGCVFAHVGSSAFVAADSSNHLCLVHAIMSSQLFTFLVRVMAGWNYEVGTLQKSPFPELSLGQEEALSLLSRSSWALKRKLDFFIESSHAFYFASSARKHTNRLELSAIGTELDRIQLEIDDLCFKLYGIEGENRRQIEEWANRKSGQRSVDSELQEEEGEQGSEEDSEEEGAAGTDDLSSLLSWCVGVAFGRFDIRLATGERQPPPDPEPFDPLPKRSPGMVPEGDPVFRPGSGIFVDDPGHADDLTTCVRSVLERVSIPAPDNLRQWLAKDFFPLHIRMYSKSRRKAPIYWQLSTPSGSYSVWVYIHAFTRDTLFRVQNDYIAPKLEHELRRLESMRSGVSTTAKAAEHKALAVQEAFVQELKDLLAELRLVTPLWEPELDDGVVINSAPLWRLFPQNKAWQKELRSIWSSLCAGKFDWSHMAMHLWPDRVVPKCANDRSLAIAHGLEDIFWAEGADGKWAKRHEPGTSLDELLMDRESRTVKDSLASLLGAPAAGTGQTGRRGRSKGN